MRVGLLIAIVLSVVSTVWGQHSVLLEQWQPQACVQADGHETDRRLEQSVRIEIIGRAATSALQLLSEKTGVSLGVMPEDLGTVGERKLTIIAQGCNLKTLLVQIPEALQECHFDIDTRGAQPVYFLHRNERTDDLLLKAAEESERPAREKARAARETRLAEARTALAMSPEELEKLRAIDPLLVTVVKDMETRQRLELLLGLPEQNMQEFLTTGHTWMAYSTAPKTYQEAARAQLGQLAPYPEDVPKEVVLAESDIEFAESLYYTFFRVVCCDTKGLLGEKGEGHYIGSHLALLCRAPGAGIEVPLLLRPLLMRVGYDKPTADAVLGGLVNEHEEQKQAEREVERAIKRREPNNPKLEQLTTMPMPGDTLVEVQQFVAKETGLSIVSDYFTPSMPYGRSPEDPKPIWQMLYDLGEQPDDGFEWRETGDCLVFHHRQWYTLAVQELPESMVLTYREKLEQQGCFTLDDVANAAAELERRRPVPVGQRGRSPWELVVVPRDLQEAGLEGLVLRSGALCLWAFLTSDQRKQTESADGLPYTKMTAAQRKLVQSYACYFGELKRSVPEEEVQQATFRLILSDREFNGVSDKLYYRMRIEFPSLKKDVGLWLPEQPVKNGRS